MKLNALQMKQDGQERVMNNEQVVRQWAAGNGGAAHSSNISYEGSVLYSYGVAIGWIHHRRIALIDLKKFSATTSRHIQLARVEAKKNMTTLALPLGDPRDWKPEAVGDSLNRLIEYLAESFARARTLRSKRAFYTDMLKAGEMCSAAELLFPDYDFSELRLCLNVESKSLESQLEIKERGQVDSWLAGTSDRLDCHNVYLRVREGEVQTSKGITISLKDAFKIFQLWRKCGGFGDTYQIDNEKDFTPHHVVIYPDLVRSGCHTLKRGELERFANSQGWYNTVENNTEEGEHGLP